jgi:hypothetical protein
VRWQSGDAALGRAERGGLGDRTKSAVAATALPDLTDNFRSLAGSCLGLWVALRLAWRFTAFGKLRNPVIRNEPAAPRFLWDCGARI